MDRTPPAPPKASFPGPDGDNGWYRTLTVRWTCSDPSGASCPSQTFTAAGRNQFARQVARDGAGNVSAEAVAGPFNFDNGAALASPFTPSPGAILTDEPTYVWRNATDPTSGQARSEVWARWTGVSDQLIARVAAPAARSARNVRTTPLPIRTPIRWFVRYYDRAGNHSDSAARTFTIDPTPPSARRRSRPARRAHQLARAEVHVEGRRQPTFTWRLTADGADEPAQQGRGPAQSVALQQLPTATTRSASRRSPPSAWRAPEATRSFTVDTVAPAAPVVTLRPPAAVTGPRRVRVDHRAGAFSRWAVFNPAGQQMRAPVDTPAARATIGALAAGGYTFHLQQIDAAGNASPPVDEAFSVGASAVRPAAKPRLTALPAQNAGRLRPRKGARLLTERPALRWKKGPRGTTLYNVQLFRAVGTRPGAAAGEGVLRLPAGAPACWCRGRPPRRPPATSGASGRTSGDDVHAEAARDQQLLHRRGEAVLRKARAKARGR